MTSLSILCSLLAVSGTHTGQPEPPKAWAALSLSTDRTTTTAHAPLQFWVVLKNVSDQPITGSFELGTSQGGARIQFGRAGTPPVDLAYLDQHLMPNEEDPGKNLIRDFSPAPRRVLEPGQEMAASGLLAFDPVRKVFLLAETGEYELRVTFSDPVTRTRLQSNVVQVTVKPPQGSEQEALDAFTPEFALIAQRDWRARGLPERAYLDAHEFLDRFERSDYAYLLRSGLESVVPSSRGEQSAVLLEKLRQERQETPPVPPGGRERAAYDAFTEEMAQISDYGVSGDLRALELPVEAILDAGRYLARFPDSAKSPVLRMRLSMLLKARAYRGTITPEERTLLVQVKPKH